MNEQSFFKLVMHGTRGTQGVSGPDHIKYGGLTTCVEVLSDKLPPGELFFLDAGTGFAHAIKAYMPDIVEGKIKVIHVLNTHPHKDHIEGTLTYPLSYNVPFETRTHFYGSKPPSGRSHKDVVLGQFDGDTWPIEQGLLNHRLKFTTLTHYPSQVFIIHPEGGFHLMDLGRLQDAEEVGQIRLSKKVVNLNECMVVRMKKTSHSNANCLSPRLEDRETGAVGVFCSDHEARSAPSGEIKAHFWEADVLISDCAYTRAQAVALTAGWGHGVGMGVIREALAGRVKSLDLTHHVTSSSDQRIDGEIRDEVNAAYEHYVGDEKFMEEQKLDKPTFTPDDIHMCHDGMVIDVLEAHLRS